MYKNIIEINEAVLLPTNEDEDEWVSYNTYLVVSHLQEAWSKTKIHCKCQEEQYDFEAIRNNPEQQVNETKTVNKIDVIDQQILDILKIQTHFPKSFNQSFNRSFRQLVRIICVKACQVYTHLQEHSSVLDENVRWNFRYFVAFLHEFQLLNQNDLEQFKQLWFQQ